MASPDLAGNPHRSPTREIFRETRGRVAGVCGTRQPHRNGLKAQVVSGRAFRVGWSCPWPNPPRAGPPHQPRKTIGRCLANGLRAGRRWIGPETWRRPPGSHRLRGPSGAVLGPRPAPEPQRSGGPTRRDGRASRGRGDPPSPWQAAHPAVEPDARATLSSGLESRTLHRVGWRIELLFKPCKQGDGLSRPRGHDPDRVLAEVYAKLLGASVRHWALPRGVGSEIARSPVEATRWIREDAVILAKIVSRSVWDGSGEVLDDVRIELSATTRIDQPSATARCFPDPRRPKPPRDPIDLSSFLRVAEHRRTLPPGKLPVFGRFEFSCRRPARASSWRSRGRRRRPCAGRGSCRAATLPR